MSGQYQSDGSAQLLNGVVKYNSSDSTAAGAPYFGAVNGGSLNSSEKTELVRHALNSINYVRVRVPFADACLALSLMFFQLNFMVEFICDKIAYDNISYSNYYYTNNSSNLCDPKKLLHSKVALGAIAVGFGFLKIILELIYNKSLKCKIAEVCFGFFALGSGLWWLIDYACSETNKCHLDPAFSALIAFAAIATVGALVKAILSCFIKDEVYCAIMPRDKSTYVQGIAQTFGNNGNGHQQIVIQSVPVQAQMVQMPVYVVPQQ